MSESAVKVVRMIRSSSSQDISKHRESIRVLLEQNVALLIGAGEGFKVETEVGGKTTQYFVDIAQQHLGRLLGVRGKNIGALRTLISAMAMVHGFRAVIAIKDEERFF